MPLSRVICCLLGVLFLGACAQEEAAHLDIFYTADVEGFYHSRPEPRFANQEAGGYGILKSFLAHQTQPYLLFDGGNWYGSTPQAALTQGAYVTALLREIPYSAVSVSEKDFAFGWLALRDIVRQLPYPALVANLKADNQIPRPLHDYHIFTQDGIKVGVFGLVSPVLMQNHKTRLTGFTVTDPVQTAQEMVELLQRKGVDFIILLSSLGDNTTDSPVDALLAEEVPGIDLLLSANKDRETAETDQINKTFLVYPGAKLDSIAHIRVFFDKNKQVKDITFADIPLLYDSWGEDGAISTQVAHLQHDTQKKTQRTCFTGCTSNFYTAKSRIGVRQLAGGLFAQMG